MPLQAVQFKPGINREGTTLANESGWYAGDKIRFRAGLPQKIGGWVLDSGVSVGGLEPPAGAYWGVARSLYNWINQAGSNLLGIGTNLKYYIQSSVGGDLYDITPLRATTAAGDVTFAAVNGSTTITVTDAGHGAQAGDFVAYSGAASLGGAITADVLNAEHRVATFISGSQYTIEVSVAANASDTGDGGAAVVGAYQITSGAMTYTVGTGWGAGGWGGISPPAADTGWGVAAPSALGIGLQLRTWSQGNYGQDLIINPRGGALYYWLNNANPNLFDRAELLSSTSSGVFQTDTSCPSVCNYVLVADAARMVVALGVNDYGESVQDPLLVRWSAQEDYSLWFPAATNQAGSYRVSVGSRLISGLQTRQEILVWTDSALYSMQYQGPPTVWGFQLLAGNLSIAGPNAMATADDITYWMGVDNFYVYNGRVQPLRCDLRQYVFGDLNLSQQFQIAAGTNTAFGEVWWFYCSAESAVVDRYVVYNYQEDVWYYGTMARTAWVDARLREKPIAAAGNGKLLYHESGTDDGETSTLQPIHAYIESADFDLGDGNNFSLVDRIIPDVNFDGSTSAAPAITMAVRPRQFPGSAYGTSGSPSVTSANNFSAQRTYEVQQFTPQVFVRVRGRQLALRIESNVLGTAWQMGVPRLGIRQDGRR